MLASYLEKAKKWPWPTILIIACMVDVLLLPYIRFLSCSLAMLIVLAWYVVRVVKTKRLLLDVWTIVAVAWIVASLGVGLIQGITSSLKVGIMICFAFLFFELLKRKLDGAFLERIVSKILFIYITVVFCFALLYIVHPQLYFNIRSFWTMGNTKIEFYNWVMNRYTFIYSDPNNAGCAFTAILAYVLFCEKHERKQELFYIFALSVSTVATQSMQSLFALFVVLCVYTYFFLRAATKKTVIIFASCMLGVIVLAFALKNVWMRIDIVRSVLQRLLNSNLGTGGGRVGYWKATLQNAFSWYNVFIGKGGVVDAAGKTYLPHSGFLYTAISYGMLTTVLFVKTFFVLPKKTKLLHYLVVFPLIIIFAINTGVIDYRFLCTLALLSAFMNVRAEHPADGTSK